MRRSSEVEVRGTWNLRSVVASRPTDLVVDGCELGLGTVFFMTNHLSRSSLSTTARVAHHCPKLPTGLMTPSR